ncbi:hypothetical protein RN001_001845 [Aquatica leii]|uniref:Integrator complex subunit 14 n=1 Tax=Aquatica leii TaxID=1421715 RepID=A0AAN7Q4M3_9COLE|nr:hypothetical protein RN001_001845 [Aquatica leii]
MRFINYWFHLQQYIRFMVAFSSLYEERCAFTRDYNAIKTELQKLDDYDKTGIESALQGASQLVLGEWGNNIACQFVLITDGNTGVGPLSLTESFSTLNHRNASNPFPLPFAFPAKLHVVCIAPNNDPNLVKSKPLYQRLVDMTGYDGSVLIPDGNLCESTIVSMFQKLAEDMYTSFRGTLKCGNLESRVTLSPAPIPYTKLTDFDCQTNVLSELIEVCGFMPIADVGSPMAISRHLILPTSSLGKENLPLNAEIDLADEDTAEEGKVPSFCVLLHGALKVENMTALVTLGENWFGFIYSWADSKKKSNLMLTVLTPGSDAVPWLGDLNHLDSSDNLMPEQVGSFPVRPSEKRSYSQNGVELNRLRKAAISLGFLDLLNGLAYIFEQECTQLPGSAHPDCALQLTHAADVLRKTQNKDIKYVILPLITNYNSS